MEEEEDVHLGQKVVGDEEEDTHCGDEGSRRRLHSCRRRGEWYWVGCKKGGISLEVALGTDACHQVVERWDSRTSGESRPSLYLRPG